MNYRNSYYLTHPWEIFGEGYRNVKWFIQRGRRGYSEMDVWNLDHYLSSWLPKAIRELRDYKNSYPDSFAGWCEEMTPKKWYNILTKMAEGFESMDDIPLEKWMKENLKKQKGRDLFSYWFWSLWD